MASVTGLNRSTVMAELSRMVHNNEAKRIDPERANGAAYYQKHSGAQLLLRFKWDRSLEL